MLANERAKITSLYEKLDQERNNAAAELDSALKGGKGGGWEREVAVSTWSAQVSRLKAAEEGLCFGRIDGEAGESTYVGRVGLFDEEYEPLLTDWRAPAARRFYTATAANPEGIVLRRHFHTAGRELRDFHDDELLSDMTALRTALDAPRSSVMRDIVQTIQSEQDEIIRSPHQGVLVIEGGPGTGKTAVALHRVAYLLYVQRERLSRKGVLVVGPNSGFLRYIGDVLPSLGETDVVFATPGELYPGVVTAAEDTPELQRFKGSLHILDALHAAVADRQQVPVDPIPIELEDVTVPLDAYVAAVAREKARSFDLPHNVARKHFFLALAEELVLPAVELIGYDWAEIEADVRHELLNSHSLRQAVDELWPELTPEQLLADLYAGRCFRIGMSRLHRADPTAWTVSDIPLLDELAELLGTDGSAERVLAETERAEREYAEGVMQILDNDYEMYDDDYTRTVDWVTTHVLTGRHTVVDHRTLAERASADRQWTYGHVVVDEAQELAPMDWRILMRRCPAKSMTVVGDLAQRQSSAGVRGWDEVHPRFEYRRLEINYRTPGEVMDVAAPVLEVVDPFAVVPMSVRRNGIRPWSRFVLDLEEAVQTELEMHTTGTIAVIGPGGLTPKEAKGLEFDVVIVTEPQRMSPSELYVALTRATQRLGVLHTEPLPSWLCWE
ncbi:DNA helicase [Lentzea sp. NBRC 105346]|uniref:UvrD-helicase domain-containing protein n=1 Tax=Lentzea sp. NBRC 105346 TaxID=3032205 RepID=UPI0024A1AB5F|nr:UvrD-helicase domain-containing protein [Lentzea sp. NBRC 105346]GLZ34167.1 DNA helicase [Lentzea sp. NBRC 105346]